MREETTNNTHVQVVESTHVQLSESTRAEQGRLNQSVSPKVTARQEPNQVKGNAMKGFDLGTGIIISPNLLHGIGVQGSKGNKNKGRPPDTKESSSVEIQGHGSQGNVNLNLEEEDAA
ncbi:hypothetical protein RIF29_15927 [Crotalaria pallida]|uniref:Uncharacterized protein n=1 Tax=Crotalaria pallida TaxID=3830 RepID=A0AAN9FLG4_CROPI